MTRTWASFLGLIFKRNAILHLNLGQSLASFARVGLPFALLRLIRPELKVVTSLHGSIFMEWHKGSLVTRIFLGYLAASQAITVLGESQRRKLLELGVPEAKIKVIQNTCEVELTLDASVRKKHQNDSIIRLLYLSLLIESKGYPEFLEALEYLANMPLTFRIEAVLCGPMSFTNYCRRFDDEKSKKFWIHEKLSAINKRGDSRVRVEWIRGAAGADKQALFDQAEIFVFPTQFPVEAQPLVLLEAMASGCAIITTDVGEIPSTVDASIATIETDPTAKNLAEHIVALAESPEERLKRGLSGLHRMRDEYSVAKHLERWQRLLETLN
ncbi:glycosyltransferase family 4 protein [Akkermansiaceae bacterium]|nr:glycosyltransferase family 4 protein [Akkermansiaceae bacterium]